MRYNKRFKSISKERSLVGKVIDGKYIQVKDLPPEEQSSKLPYGVQTQEFKREITFNEFEEGKI